MSDFDSVAKERSKPFLLGLFVAALGLMVMTWGEQVRGDIDSIAASTDGSAPQPPSSTQENLTSWQFTASPLVMPSQDDAQTDEEDDEPIDVQTDIMERHARFCYEAIEEFGQSVGIRAVRQVDRAASTFKRRFRDGGNIYVRVSQVRETDEGTLKLSIDEILGIGRRIEGVHFVGANFEVVPMDDGDTIEPGAILEIHGEPQVIARDSRDTAEYRSVELELLPKHELLQTECGPMCTIMFFMVDAKITRVLSDDDLPSNNDRIIR